MTNEEVTVFLQKITNDCAHEVEKSTVAFYGVQNSVPKQYGTGFLLQIGDEKFIITAAHVIDFPIVHKIPTFVGASLNGATAIGIRSDAVLFSEMPKSGTRLDDPIDIAVVCLPADIAKEIIATGKSFLHLYDLDPMDDRDGCNFYLMLGFPCEWSRSDIANRFVYSTLWPFGTGIYGGERGKIQKYIDEIHIALDFNAVNTPPDPHGISGCAIWRTYKKGVNPSDWTSEQKKLVGIEHTWFPSEKVLTGTQIRYVLQMLYREFPKLRAAIDMNFGSLPGSIAVIERKIWTPS